MTAELTIAQSREAEQLGVSPEAYAAALEVQEARAAAAAGMSLATHRAIRAYMAERPMTLEKWRELRGGPEGARGGQAGR